MKELITRAQADTLILALGVLGLIAAGVGARVARRTGRSGLRYALLSGGPLVLIAALWPLYNAIEDRFGLDSVAAMTINGLLFVALGALVGLGWRRLNASADPEPAMTTEAD